MKRDGRGSVEMEESGGHHYEAPIRETFGERPVLERWYPYNLRITLLGPLQGQAQSSSSGRDIAGGAER